MVSDEVRGAAAGADDRFAVSEETGALDGGASSGDDESRDCAPDAVVVVFSTGSFAVSAPVPAASSVRVDDVSCVFVDFRRSPLRNRRHVSEELCSVSAVLGPTAGFAPIALLVSTSSCPLMGNPLRI